MDNVNSFDKNASDDEPIADMTEKDRDGLEKEDSERNGSFGDLDIDSFRREMDLSDSDFESDDESIVLSIISTNVTKLEKNLEKDGCWYWTKLLTLYTLALVVGFNLFGIAIYFVKDLQAGKIVRPFILNPSDVVTNQI